MTDLSKRHIVSYWQDGHQVMVHRTSVGFMGLVPNFPGCAAGGKDFEELRSRMAGVIERAEAGVGGSWGESKWTN